MRTVLIAAQSLDGFITRHDTPGTAFTSPDDKAWFAATLRSFDCSVMGGETYRVARDFIRARLTPERLRFVLTRAPAAYAADQVPEQLEFVGGSGAELLTQLAARGRAQCALLGGAQVHRMFLLAGLVDELWVTVEPRLFGDGTPFLAGPADIPLHLRSHELLGAGALLVKYDVAR